MNTTNKNKWFKGGFSLLEMIICIAIIALFVALAIPKVQAKDWFYQTNALAPGLTNVQQTPGSTATVTSNSFAGTAFTVPQNVAWSLTIPNTVLSNGVAGGIGTSNTTYYVDFSPFPASANTGFTTTHPVSLTAAQNGATGVTFGTNFASSSFNGYQSGKITAVATSLTNNVVTPSSIIGAFQ